MAVDAEEELIYIGDDGPNVKILDWQNGNKIVMLPVKFTFNGLLNDQVESPMDQRGRGHMVGETI